MRLAIVTSHPIQYQAPWFRELARRADVHVFFCHKQDEQGQASAGYGTAFRWDVPLLDGYQYTWLKNVSRDPGVFGFRGCDTPEIHDRLADGRFDACIVNGWYLKSYVQAIFACRRLRIPVFLRGDSHRAADRPLLSRALKYPLYRALLNSVTGHLYVGRSNRDYLRHYGVPDERLWFVPHCVDDRWFGRQAAEARARGADLRIRERFGIAPGDTVALFVGRLVAQKRPLDFVEAIAQGRSRSALTGLVVGSGPLRETAEDVSKRRDAGVHFAGFANQSELPSYYAAADLLVLPSDAGETWGLVANEALACGTPLVVSDHAGCSRDLIEAWTGRSFPCGDVAALTSAMLAVADMRQTSRAMVDAAVQTVSHRFGVEAAADATIAAIREALHATRVAVPATTNSVQS